jgi:DNA-binding transcriptional regulator YiaG
MKDRDAQAARLKAHRKELSGAGLSGRKLDRAMLPLETFHKQLEEDIQIYEALKKGDKKVLSRLGFGQQLVALRIANGLTQRELAERLGVHESQVSRDERNEYHGITVERADKVLAALGLRLVPTYKVALPA